MKELKQFFRLLVLIIAFFFTVIIQAQNFGKQLSTEKAWKWYKEYPWICGFNYIPSNAINYTAMWDKTSFSPDLIDKELSLASATGFNTLRVVLQFIVWEDDPKYFRDTFTRFLIICTKH